MTEDVARTKARYYAEAAERTLKTPGSDFEMTHRFTAASAFATLAIFYQREADREEQMVRPDEAGSSPSGG